MLSVACDECGHLITGEVHARALMRVRDGELRLASATMHYHWPCLLAWGTRTAVQEKITVPMSAARLPGRSCS